MNQNRFLHFVILAGVCIFAFFLHRESFYVNIMEARNFVTAREMIEKANWLVPTMNGELRLAKPPFPTWVTAFFGSWFGIDNISMLRFPAGLVASLMVFFIYSLTVTLHRNRRMALINGLVLASSFYVVYMGRTGTWDIYCHSFMLGAIWLLVKAWQSEGQKWGTFAGAGALLGLSFLSKGPVAFFAMLLPFLISYIIVFGGREITRKWKPFILSLVIFTIISFWWPVYIYTMHAAEAAAVAKLESGSWVNRHIRPFWYYWNFPIQTGIWTLFLTTALIFPYGFRRFKERNGYRFAFLWTIFAVVLLSFFPEKKDRYLLPVLIPSALLVGYYLNYLLEVYREKKQDRWDDLLMGINSWLIAIIALGMPVGLWFMFYSPGYMELGIFIGMSVVLEVIFLLMVLSWRKRNISGILGGIVLMMAVVEGVLLPYVDSISNRNPDFHDIRLVRDLEPVKGLNLYSFDGEEFRIELIWEVGREVKVWNVNEEHQLPEQGSFAVFSTQKPQEILPPDVLNKVNIEVLDYYDYNRYTKGKKRNKPHFQKYVSLISPKVALEGVSDSLSTSVVKE